jgi:DNA adenine methylase
MDLDWLKTIPIKSLAPMNQSPLRYPGGKTRACKILEEIVCQQFDISAFDRIISPFFGGGSFEFYMQNKYNLRIIANDKFAPLANFWLVCKTHRDDLVAELEKKIDRISKTEFLEYRAQIMEEPQQLEQSVMYFIINRCSFSGATLSGGFSQDASKNRFTRSSIQKISQLELQEFEIANQDFTNFLSQLEQSPRDLLFLDPPYYLDKGSKLYGKSGDMHEGFPHEVLFRIIENRQNWIMTYNDCDYIRDLYKDFLIIPAEWSYGMNKTKKSSEIVIIGRRI